MIVNDPNKAFNTIPSTMPHTMPHGIPYTATQSSMYSNLIHDYPTKEDISALKKDMLIHKLQTLKMLSKIEESQYKSILGMLASPDERDAEMARLSIRTLWDEQL